MAAPAAVPFAPVVFIPATLIVLTPTESSVHTPAATPVNWEPSPTKLPAVTIPENVALPGEC